MLAANNFATLCPFETLANTPMTGSKIPDTTCQVPLCPQTFKFAFTGNFSDLQR